MEWMTEEGVRKLIGREMDVQFADGRRAFGRVMDVDLDLMSVTLSREDQGLLIQTCFPISMARDVQTR